MNDTTKIAFIGAGYWGPNLIRNFNHLADSEVTLVCELDLGRLNHVATLFPGVTMTLNWQDVIDSDVDAVCVATPVAWHFEMAVAALQSGKHVFVEKPLTADGPARYDTFGDFQFSYRYGDIYTPFLASTEPLSVECHHFLDCIAGEVTPRSGGKEGLEVVQVLEAADRSLRDGGSKVKIK